MKNLATIFLMLFSIQAFAQQELVLPLHESIPQRILLNPAAMQENKWSIALPSVAFNFANSGFTYNHLIRPRPQDDSLFLDLKNATEKMADHNYIFTNYNINFLTLGHRKKNYQFGFYVSDKVNISLKYPKELPLFFWSGNAQFIGEEVNIGPRLKAIKYRELGASFSLKFSDKLQAGVRLKYLQGLADISTRINGLTVYTDSTDYNITVSTNYRINTTNIHAFEDVVSPLNINNPNYGWGADFGVNYHPSKQWSFAGSVLDLGNIRWVSGTVNYKSHGAYTFKGVDISSYVSDDTLSMEDYLDTLEQTFGFVKDSENYRTTLVPKVYLNVKYRPDKMSYIALQVFGEFIDGIHPAVTVGYARTFDEFFGLPVKLSPGIYWSYKNRSLNNFGFATTIQWKSIQFFLAGDNLLSFFLPKAVIPLNRLQPVFPEDSKRSLTIPKDLKNYNFRLGINILFK